MSRGFGSTFGSGGSDVVTTGSTGNGDDQITYSVWVYRNGAGGGNFGHIFSKQGTGAAPNNWSENFFWNNTATTFGYIRVNSGGTITARHHVTQTGLTSLQVWLHIMLTHDQSGGVTAPIGYYNGVQNNVTPIQGFAGSSTAGFPTLIGNTYDNTRAWDGCIAHFCKWSGVILSEVHARALTAGMHPMNFYPEKVQCYLPLDGVNGYEWDHIVSNGPASITGAKLGGRQPPATPLYIEQNNGWRRDLLQAQAGAAANSNPMVSWIF